MRRLCYLTPCSRAGEGKPEAYKLKPASPCIGAGTVVMGNGGKDFFGNPVPANAPPTMCAFQAGP
jgi:hypothetical protein